MLLVERFHELPNITLEDALEMAAPWRAGASAEEEVEAATASGSRTRYSTSEAGRRAQEERDMAELDALMAGTVSRRT